MQKPNYISIEIPAGLKDFSSAVVKYLNANKGKIVDLDFSQERHRKTFKYKIVYSRAETWYGAMDGQSSKKLKIQLVKI